MNTKRFFVIAFIALVFILAALLPCAALAAGDGAITYRALLIGIESYDSNPLEGPVNDVNRMSSTLQAANEAGSIYQTPATRTNLKASEIVSVLNEVPEWGADQDDVTFFYFAGYGLVGEDGVSSIVGVDGQAVKLSDVRAILDTVPGTKLVVLDCRYDDGQVEQSGMNADALLDKFNQGAADAFRGGTASSQQYYLLSLASTAQATRSANLSGSLATYYLTEGCGYDYAAQRASDLLADTNQNSAVSLSEAAAYIQDRVSALSTQAGATINSRQEVYPEGSAYPLLSRRATAEALSVTLSQSTVSIPAGNSTQLDASIQPVNAMGEGIRWTSGDLSVATVDEQGVVTGVRAGATQITAVTESGLLARCQVLVRDVTFAESVSLDYSKLVIAGGETRQLSLSVEPADSNEIITWKSNDASVATVSDSGLVSTLRTGSTVITAQTESGKQVSCVVQVVDADSVVTSVTVSPKSISIYEGGASLLESAVKPANAFDTGITYISSDPEIASVSSNGLVAGNAPGTATITALSSSGVSAQVPVTVKGAEITLKKKSVTLKKDQSATLKYTISPAGMMLDVTWLSSDPQIVTVTDGGVITGHEYGTASVTAQLPSGMKAVCKVSVAGVQVKGVKLSKSKMNMSVGAQTQLTAKVSPSNASITDCEFASSNEGVATVDSTGMVTANAVGKATITATSHNGKKAKCVVTVKPAQVSSITLNTTEESFVLGMGETTLQLEAEMEPVSSNGNRSLKWASSNTKVASVDENGLVTIKGSGTCRIRASSGNVKAECKIVVAANKALYKKATTGNEKKVYASTRQILYKDNQLVVQMYFVNRSSKAVQLPTEGTLTLTLSTGETYPLKELTPTSKKKLSKGKSTVVTFKFSLDENPQLSGLDLRGSLASIETGDSAAGTADATAGAETQDAGEQV